jgi:hypothetical protein
MAMAAMSAIASATASASLPEWTPTIDNFTAKSGKSTLETVSGEKIVCKEDKVTGERTSAKTGKATITFIGCEANGLKCNSAGAKNGEITFAATFLIVEQNLLKREASAVSRF